MYSDNCLYYFTVAEHCGTTGVFIQVRNNTAQMNEQCEYIAAFAAYRGFAGEIVIRRTQGDRGQLLHLNLQLEIVGNG